MAAVRSFIVGVGLVPVRGVLSSRWHFPCECDEDGVGRERGLISSLGLAVVRMVISDWLKWRKQPRAGRFASIEQSDNSAPLAAISSGKNGVERN